MRVALAGALALLLVTASSAAALEHKLTAADGAASDRLGTSVSIGGGTIVLGAPGDDAGRGSVYVFQRSGDTWMNTAKLTASDGAPGDGLGSSVALNGDTIVAGAPGDAIGANRSQGSVYTFARSGAAARSETAKLTAVDGAVGDGLGSSVAIDGDTIVAGAPGHVVDGHGSQGAVYTFASVGPAARTETAELTASDGAASDLLGASVAIDGDTIVAGAPTDDGGGRGSAYTFARSGAAARTDTAKLTPSDSQVLRLGSSVEIDGDTIVVGAPGTNDGRGSVYTFARTGPRTRTETAKLTASDGVTNASLGSSVAIDAATIVAGGALNTGATGAVYTFGRTGPTARTETAKLIDPDGAPGDTLGQSVAIDAGTTVAGSPRDEVGTNVDQGSASVFFQPALPPPPPPPPPPAKLVLSRLTITPGTFQTGASLAKTSRLRHGTTIRFTLSRIATVKLSFARAAPGRTVAGRCQATRRANHAKPRCTRHIAIGSFTVQGRGGPNSVRFTGVLSGKRLAPGSYKLTATPTDSTHTQGQPRTARLTITAKRTTSSNRSSHA